MSISITAARAPANTDTTTFDASAIVSGTFADARISQSSVTQHQAALALATSQITSGTFADAFITQSSVTQHQAAFALATSQITSGTFADARIAVSNVTQHETGINHNALANLTLADPHTQYAVLAGRSGGQTIIGGTFANQDVTLQGCTLTGTSRGSVVLSGRVELVDVVEQPKTTGLLASTPNILIDEAVASAGSGLDVYTGLHIEQAFTVNTNIFFYGALWCDSTFTQTVNPLLSAFTLFQARPVLRRGAGSSVAAIILNAAPTIEQHSTGTMTQEDLNAVAFKPVFDADSGGNSSTLNTNLTIGLEMQVSVDYPTGSSLDLEDVYGVRLRPAATATGGAATGTRSQRSHIGLFFMHETFNPSFLNCAVYAETDRSVGSSAYGWYQQSNDAGAKAAPNFFGGGGTSDFHGIAFPSINRTISADQDDYDAADITPETQAQRACVRVTASGANRTITGLDATDARSGQTIKIVNVSASNTVTLADENVSSSAANRIISPTGADYVLSAEQSAILHYDATSARWRIESGTGA